MNVKNYTVSDINQLSDVAEYIVSMLPANSIFLFDGEMGAGKTTLINEICKKIEILEQPSSPTYSIVNTYSSKQYGELYHFDFYRLKGEKEAVESGLDELIHSGKICFIEWGEKVSKLLPINFVRVNIKVVSTNHRMIEIIKN